MECNFEFVYKLSLKEYLNAYDEVLKISKFQIIDKIFGSILIILSVVLFVVSKRHSVVGPLFLLVMGLDLLFRLIKLDHIPVIFAYKRNDLLKAEKKLIFNEDEIIYETGTVKSKISWDTYKAIYEIQDSFVLFYNPRQYAVLPKKGLQNSSLNEFQDFLTKKLQSNFYTKDSLNKFKVK